MLRVNRGALAAVPALILAAGVARAAPSKVVEGEALIDGEHAFSEVIVKQGATLRVRPMVTYADGVTGLGWVRLKAGRVVVEAGGAIDATGAGYQGVDGADGGQPAGTTGAGRFAANVPRPGTGGASAGAGAPGMNLTCGPHGTPGGDPYPDPVTLFLPGSAGGAAHLLDAALPSRGGHGGGVIEIEAADVEILGSVLARGGDGIAAVTDAASGGGAGGAIRIVSAALTGSGLISAAGGRGGSASRSGGGGGGGVILLVTPGGAAPASLTVDVGGGASGGCAGSAGGDGIVAEQQGEACLDVDGDGHLAASCAGGDDCDDGDPDIHLGAEEICDGQDNDCSGAADDDLPAGACPDGATCQAGGCVAEPDAGPPPADAGPAGAAPDHLEYQGGCSLGGAPAGWWAAALAGLGLAGALVRRRTSRRRGRRMRTAAVVSRGKLP